MRRTVDSILESYRAGTETPRGLISRIQAEIDADPGRDALFIRRLNAQDLEPYLLRLERENPSMLPLFGVPFVIKDNIDLAGVPTTAACPDYAYTPEHSSFVVELLIQAGAIPLGKVNLDQFATGLVGVRSPYGVPSNPINPGYIPGGSSSGSAVAVAQGYAAFSLGTDTAGSGRVPAAFNELIGLKPSRGILSNRGVVPACRSLDCVSVFAHTVGDARAVFEAICRFDPNDDFARPYEGHAIVFPDRVRVGIPDVKDLCFFGNASYENKFYEYLDALSGIPQVELKTIDFAPFLDAARLLYEGSWVAERHAAVGGFLDRYPDAAHPVTASIIAKGKALDATFVFENMYALQRCRRRAESVMREVDLVVTPTTGTHYRVSEVLADPLQTNSNLGYYTNFMNLLDFAALAIPADRTASGLPFGVTLFAPSQSDHALMGFAAMLRNEPFSAYTRAEDRMELAVCGAHMRGLPLSQQWLSIGGKYVREISTAPAYRMICLHHKDPIRPGLVRCPNGADGASLEMELWSLPVDQVGRFLSMIEEPLGLGSIETADGKWVHGFLCEAAVASLPSSEDITHHGSWRRFLASRY